MIENIAGKAVLVLGVQLPLVIGITACLAKRDGVKINWFRVGVLSTALFAVLATAVWIVGVSCLGTRNTILLAFFGTITGSLAIARVVTPRKSKMVDS